MRLSSSCFILAVVVCRGFTPSERAQTPTWLSASLTGSLTGQERDTVHRRAVRVRLLCDSHCACAVGHLTVSYCTALTKTLSLSLSRRVSAVATVVQFLLGSRLRLVVFLVRSSTVVDLRVFLLFNLSPLLCRSVSLDCYSRPDSLTSLRSVIEELRPLAPCWLRTWRTPDRGAIAQGVRV